MQKGPYRGHNSFLPTPIKNRLSIQDWRFIIVLKILPGKTRTYDLMVRSHALYPTGLRAESDDHRSSNLFILPQEF